MIQSIPNAIGALCLNQAGQDQLASRPSIVPGLFSIFTSERHLKILNDKENAALIGSSIDELIRHHPTLKGVVFDSLKSTLGKIECLGNAYTPAEDIQHWYQLMITPTTSTVDSDVIMEDVDTVQDTDASPTGGVNNETPGPFNDETASKPHDNLVVSFMSVLGRVRGFCSYVS